MADEEAARKADIYRSRAEEIRAAAETTKNPQARETLLRLAAAYEHMAEILDRTERSVQPAKSGPPKIRRSKDSWLE